MPARAMLARARENERDVVRRAAGTVPAGEAVAVTLPDSVAALLGRQVAATTADASAAAKR